MRPPRFLAVAIALWAAAVAALPARQTATTTFMPVRDVRPGMVGVGRTVFAGDTLTDFRVEIIGALANVTAPGRTLIIAKLSGSATDTGGVIAGMSGSPVYIDGKLIGAVSYALGAFPKEPIAGITPIEEMLADVDRPASTRPASRAFALGARATAADAMQMFRRVMLAAAGTDMPDASPVSAAPLADGWLRPIANVISMRGFDASLSAGVADLTGAHAPQTAAPSTGTLRPGDAVGTSLMRGDFETGASGTVTYVRDGKVYAFGHPFLGLGPIQLPMTHARVLGVLPSLQSSMKLADLGPSIGTMSQDRATAIGGTLGAGPEELAVTIHLVPTAAAPRNFAFRVSLDPSLTPLFSYVAMLNVLSSYHKQQGALTVGLTATASFGPDGTVRMDDVFSGEQAMVGVANAILGPMTAMMQNDWKMARPHTLDLTLNVSEDQSGATIERAWLDTAHPRFGGTHTLHVLLRDYRGGTQTRSLPITMPSSGPSQLTLLVGDAPTVAAFEDKDVDPNVAHSLPELVDGLNHILRNNMLYARLVASAPGTIVDGRAQPSLPVSTKSVIDADKSAAPVSIAKTIAGRWQDRVGVVVRGSKEIAITLQPAQR